MEISGQRGQRKGLENECKVIRAFNRPFTRPLWLKSLRRGSLVEDGRGVDFVATTDIGPILLQLKSFLTGSIKFRRKPEHRDIIVVVLQKKFSPAEIRREIIDLLAQERNWLLKNKY